MSQLLTVKYNRATDHLTTFRNAESFPEGRFSHDMPSLMLLLLDRAVCPGYAQLLCDLKQVLD